MRVSPPPTNTCDGLKKLPTDASIWPICVPARCTIWLAAASPARLARPTSSGVSTPAAARRSASMGLSPARAAGGASRAIAVPAGRPRRARPAEVGPAAPRRAVGAAIDLAVADNAAADARAHLQHQEVG